MMSSSLPFLSRNNILLRVARRPPATRCILPVASLARCDTRWFSAYGFEDPLPGTVRRRSRSLVKRPPSGNSDGSRRPPAEMKRENKAAARILTEKSQLWVKVVKIRPYGALLEIERKGKKKKRVGFVHVSHISQDMVSCPSSVLSIGMRVQVVVLQDDGCRLIFSMKDAKPDPSPEDSLHWGKVIKVAQDFALVEVEKSGDDFIENRVGLVHVSEMSDDFVPSPSSVLSVGIRRQVKVLQDGGERRLKLSMKVATPEGHRRLRTRSTHSGTVVKVLPSGALVEIDEPYVGYITTRVGLVHVSEMSCEYVSTPSSVLSVGTRVKVMVLTDDGKRLALSMKDVTPTLPEDFDPCTLVAFNLPREMDEDKVKKHFKAFGTVLDVDLRPHYPLDRLGEPIRHLRRLTLVTFETWESAKECAKNLKSIDVKIGKNTHKINMVIKIAYYQDYKRKLQERMDLEYEKRKVRRVWSPYLRQNARRHLHELIPHYKVDF